MATADITTWSNDYLTTAEAITHGNASGADGSCVHFIDPQHGVYQIGGFWMLLGFLVPANIGTYQTLWLRLMLCIGFFFHVFWAGPVSCWPDALGWNLVFFVINVGQLVYVAHGIRPVEFEDDLGEAYETFFKPFNITPQQFKRLVGRHGELYELDKTGHYAVEGKSLVDERLGLLLSGRMKVTAEGAFLHYVNKNQFLDSPEWESCSRESGNHFQVTITAVEKCRYIQWTRKKLENHLNREPFLSAVFEAIIGKDVMTKLYSLNAGSHHDSVHEITEEPATETTDVEGGDDARRADFQHQWTPVKDDSDVESLKARSHGGSTPSLTSGLSVVDIRASIASGRGAAGTHLPNRPDSADVHLSSEKSKLQQISE
ncbi:popeye domain-containing protein 1-B [Saccoglossus kowalevskii]|uniref:Blood vessel epicardial substance-B n=2 Tax=Saccoglossus kowalevskii TaxID=10224 RepID=A0ABM0GQF2_SACKO|nr:PREDICTED: blood vessel epicardial substance-B [Saccoglossus kowalevskii]